MSDENFVKRAINRGVIKLNLDEFEKYIASADWVDVGKPKGA